MARFHAKLLTLALEAAEADDEAGIAPTSVARARSASATSSPCPMCEFRFLVSDDAAHAICVRLSRDLFQLSEEAFGNFKVKVIQSALQYLKS